MNHRHTAIAETHTQRPPTSAPEFDLLLACARTTPDAPRIRSLVQSGIDWRTFTALATFHSVRPLVYRSLQSICWSDLPAPFQSEWHETARSLTIKTLFITGEMLRVTAEFRSARIPVAALKGSLIAQLAYGDPALREFTDLDLLVHPSDLARAMPVFERLGYRPAWDRDLATITGFLRHVGECRLVNPQLDTDIDLHWRISTKAAALAPSLADFPSGFQPVTIAGATVLSLALSELPLYLACQGGWDQWGDFRRLCDLAEFLRRYPHTDWQPSLAAARRLGGLRSMLTGLELAARLLNAPTDAPVPAPAAPLIQRDPTVAALAANTTRRLSQCHNPGEPISRYRFQLKSKAGLPGKLALIWSICADRTAQDAEWLKLPRPLWWLYTFLRPIRMSTKLRRRRA
ncbi:MAG TPA: nucleotidyltransferase family protein [Acidobacteriaceae bacterium]|nr:nucleotidyltransferase family protein [Acidobacteriaceae bacterium]